MAPPSPTPFTPSGFSGDGNSWCSNSTLGRVACPWQGIVHQRTRQQLPLPVVDEFLEQGAAQALHRAADDLAVDQHGIDDHAAVVRHDVSVDRDAARGDVDLDQGEMGRVRPGDRGWLPVEGLLEAGIDARRATMIPAGTGRLRHGGEAHFHSRNADDAHLAVTQLEVGRCALHHVAGDGEHLGAQPFAGVVDGGRRGSRCCGWRSCRNRWRSARCRPATMATSLRIDRPGVGHHLGEDRLHALPLRAGARADVDRAVRTRCAPARSRTARRRCPRHSLQRQGRDSGPSRRASRWRCRNAAKPPIACSALSMRAGEVAAVIHDRLAVAIGQAHGEGHLLRMDHVASPDLGGFEAERMRDQVHGSAPWRRPPRAGRRHDRARWAPCWSPRCAPSRRSSQSCRDRADGRRCCRRWRRRSDSTPRNRPGTCRGRRATWPSESKPTSTSCSWSREWQEHNRCSCLSSIQRTGRPTRRARKGISRSSG